MSFSISSIIASFLSIISTAAGVLSAHERSVFILAGQSNMSGRGGVFNYTQLNVTQWDGIVPPQCRPNPLIQRLDHRLNWVVAKESIHQDIDVNKTCGIGPGMPFAHMVLHRDPRIKAVGLVPCAIGGTGISEWVKGSFLYNEMIRRAKSSVRDGGKIMGLLWYQGESDTLVMEDAELYMERVRKFFVDVSAELGSPLLPVIQVALASEVGPYTREVRQAQLGIELPNVKTVDAMGLALTQPENLHLTTASQVRLGEMLAQTYQQFF